MIPVPNRIYQFLCQIPFIGRSFTKRSSQIIYDEDSVGVPPYRFVEAFFKSMILVLPLTGLIYWTTGPGKNVAEPQKVSVNLGTDAGKNANADSPIFKDYIARLKERDLVSWLRELNDHPDNELPLRMEVFAKSLTISEHLRNTSTDRKILEAATWSRVTNLFKRELARLENDAAEKLDETVIKNIIVEFASHQSKDIQAITGATQVLLEVHRLSFAINPEEKKLAQLAVKKEMEQLVISFPQNEEVANATSRILRLVYRLSEPGFGSHLIASIRQTYSRNNSEVWDKVVKSQLSDLPVGGSQFDELFEIPFDERKDRMASLITQMENNLEMADKDASLLRDAVKKIRELLSTGDWRDAATLLTVVTNLDQNNFPTEIKLDINKHRKLLEFTKQPVAPSMFEEINGGLLEFKITQAKKRLFLLISGQTYSTSVQKFSDIVSLCARLISRQELEMCIVYLYDGFDEKSDAGIRRLARANKDNFAVWKPKKGTNLSQYFQKEDLPVLIVVDEIGKILLLNPSTSTLEEQLYGIRATNESE